jgi:hypothetical protein
LGGLRDVFRSDLASDTPWSRLALWLGLGALIAAVLGAIAFALVGSFFGGVAFVLALGVAAVSLLLGIAGVVCALVGLSRREGALAVGGLVLSVVGSLPAGVALGFLVWLSSHAFNIL